MKKELFITTYRGVFGYIKPWTAVRDEKTYSQQFLTPSIVIGMEKKLFPELEQEVYDSPRRILRHRLSYQGLTEQQEQTQTRGFNTEGKGKEKRWVRPRSILTRGVMLYPNLQLAFGSRSDAEYATMQHLCLCRNEDLVLPEPDIVEVDVSEFDADRERFPGFELLFGSSHDDAFPVGYHRYQKGHPGMYGKLKIVGLPTEIRFD